MGGGLKKSGVERNMQAKVAMPIPPKSLDIPRESEIESKLTPTPYKDDEEWLNKLDLNAFRSDMRALGKRLEAGQGQADIDHLNNLINISNAFGLLGILTVWTPANPITVMALSLWVFSRWTMIAHHTMHGGYTKEDPTGRFNRGKFAIGSLNRRMFDWFDWMLPEAWNLEHNNLHHYNLGEEADPDLVERNLAHVRGSDWPMAMRYLYVFGTIAVWKWAYYAPNTYKELKVEQMRKEGKKLPEYAQQPLTFLGALNGDMNDIVHPAEFIAKVVGPYLLSRFVAIPAIASAFGGADFFYHALANMILADILTNIHAFIMIVPNHSGKDLYKFKTSTPPNSGEFYLRQVISSADFDVGNDMIDFTHGWLNYQIEHHLWPNLSMLSYQKSHQETRKICEKHGVPFIKENVLLRTWKTIQVMVGAESMREFPQEWSHSKGTVKSPTE